MVQRRGASLGCLGHPGEPHRRVGYGHGHLPGAGLHHGLHVGRYAHPPVQSGHRHQHHGHGGGHERGLRSGTLATHQIVGMGEAFRIAKEEMAIEIPRMQALRDRLAKGLQEIEEVYVNGDMQHRVPHNLNISFNYVEGESLIMAIKGIAVSSGSACTSASLEPSYVLRALGRSDELAHSSIRFTFGRFTTEEDVDFTIDLLKKKVQKLRDLSPLWDMYKDGIDINSIQWAAH